MTETSYDAIVIGTGQAGTPLARRMSGAGWKVAVLERGLVGGTCVNAGCIPTKTLVASARVAAVARRAEAYGVRIDAPVEVDMERVKERMHAVSDASRRAVRRGLEEDENVTFLHGHARFVEPHAVAVEGEVLRAERIFVNVGARARVPALPGLEQVPFWTNTGILASDELPAHLIVVGGSYVGLELGQVYRRFGSRVTVLQRGPRLVPREDEDVSEAIRAFLEQEGVTVRVNAECVAVKQRGDAVVASAECAEGEPEVVGSHLLLAVGRVPNTDDLGLEEAGIQADEHGYLRVDEHLRTSAPGVWALGDCNGRGGFTHTSYDDYEIVAANLFDGADRRVGDRVPAYALYTDPPLGRCGLTEREARASGRRVLVGKVPMTRVGRANERGETAGFLKVLADADSEEILGASLLGIECDEVVHLLIDAMAAHVPYSLLARTMHVHPTVSEFLPVVLQRLAPLE